MTDNTNFGYLGVTVTTAIDAIPIEGATVTVSQFENGSEIPVKILSTNSNGKTDIILLPTPPRENSLTPNPTGPSYSVYNVRVDKEGFYTQNSLNVPIFAGITSIQPMRLIPLVYGQAEGVIDDRVPYSELTNESTTGENLR